MKPDKAEIKKKLAKVLTFQLLEKARRINQPKQPPPANEKTN